MAQALCIKCGSACEYLTEEKVHPDCRNAELLAKTTTVSTPTFISTTANQQESIVDKIKQDRIPKTEISYVPSYIKSKQDNGKNNM